MSDGRLFQIIYLLLERRQMTVGELAARFEVSPRTIQRDIASLSAAGIPVYAQRGRGGGVRLLPGFVLDRSLLSAREQDEILFALQSYQTIGAEDNRDIITRMSGLFRRQQVDWIDVDFTAWGSRDEERRVFVTLKESILDRQLLAFDYYASNGQATAREAEPVRLNFRGSSWYLQAWCRARKDWRTFRVSRMERIRPTGQHFEARPAPPPIDTGEDDGLPVWTLTLRFSPEVAFRVYDEFDRRTIERQPDGSLLMTVDWPTGSWGNSYLLSFGNSVEVLAPPEARAELRQEAEKILKQYEK